MRAGLAVALLLVAAAPATAGERLVSYDPANADARRLTGAGLTFQFKQGLTGARIHTLMATAVPAKAMLEPAGRGALGGLAGGGEVYEIDTAKGQGRAYVRAFCPGSRRAWLEVEGLGRNRPLAVRAFGDQAGGVRLCADMAFQFRGEWRLPPGARPDPMEDVVDSGLKD